MLRGLDTAVIRVFIHVERQAGDGLRDDSYAGINRGQLHRGLRGDGLACAAGTKIE